MFESLETSSLAIWVGESLWGYPMMLGMHVVGLAIVVGIFLMLDLRILGFNKGIAYVSFVSLFKLAWIGLAINALSGFALFSSQATVFVENTPFLIKISCIAAGVIFSILILRQLDTQATAFDKGETKPDGVLMALAALSVFCWISAIIAGRLIAYL